MRHVATYKRPQPAECFPPGEFIREEMEALGWTPDALADMLKWQRSVLDDLLEGKAQVTPEMARDLSAGFGVSTQYWLNLEMAYRHWLQRQRRQPREEQG